MGGLSDGPEQRAPRRIGPILQVCRVEVYPLPPAPPVKFTQFSLTQLQLSEYRPSMESASPLTDRERRASVHRALGDPLRLAIVDALALSDMTPSEIEERFGIPSNLLAHHLGVLETAGIVTRTRSQGDGRRRYLALRPGALTEAGIAMPAESSPPPIEAERIVFVCTRNSARSPLAMALWEQGGSQIPSTSAGTHPADVVHPLAIAAAQRAGLTTGHRPQPIEGLRQPGDLLVTVCDQAHEEAPGDLHWSIPDPVREGRPEDFARTIDLLRERTTHLAGHITRQQR